jgi:drug/metabolite transporter (DMT)-like permease
MADNREAIMFKTVPDGYLFRAPNPWVFGRARFYLVNEAQKAELLAIITARSQLVFWIGLVALIGAGTAAIAYGSGHDNLTAGDVVIMLALLPVWIYAALLVPIGSTARRLQPLLAGLPQTDQRITALDLRRALRKTISFGQYIALGVSQAIMSAAFIVLVWQKTDGGRVSIFQDGGVLVFALVAVVFVVSSISFLAAAMSKAKDPPDEAGPANRSFKAALLPIFCLVVSIGLFGFVVANALQKNEREHKVALIQGRLDSLKVRMDGSLNRSRQENLKIRAAANSARISELLARLNNPTVKCEIPTDNDDPVRIESIQTCRDTARKGQDAILAEIAATTKDSWVIQQDNAAFQKEVDAFRTQIDAVQAELQAIRR